MATLHLMVGLPCSGKTTLAKKLEQERSALRLTPDAWQVGLFGQDAKEPEHDARHRFIETMLWHIASRALALGTNVILDFGFWAREERDDYRLWAKRLGAGWRAGGVASMPRVWRGGLPAGPRQATPGATIPA